MEREAQNFGSMVAAAATASWVPGSASADAEYNESEGYDQPEVLDRMIQILPVFLFAPVARNGFGSPFPDSIVDRDGAEECKHDGAKLDSKSSSR